MIEAILLIAAALATPIIIAVILEMVLGSHFNPGEIYYDPNYKRVNISASIIGLGLVAGYLVAKFTGNITERYMPLVVFGMLLLGNLVFQPLATILYSFRVYFFRPPPLLTLSLISTTATVIFVALAIGVHIFFPGNKLLVITDLSAIVLVTTILHTLVSITIFSRAPITSAIVESIVFALLITVFLAVYLQSLYRIEYSIFSALFYFLIIGGGLLLQYLERTTKKAEYSTRFGKYYDDLVHHIERVIESQISGYILFVLGLFGGAIYALYNNFTKYNIASTSLLVALVVLALYLLFSLVILAYKMSDPMYVKNSLIIVYTRHRLAKSRAEQVSSELSALLEEDKVDFELEKAFVSTRLRYNYFWHALHNSMIVTAISGLLIWLNPTRIPLPLRVSLREIIVGGLILSFLACEVPFLVGQFRMRTLLTSTLSGSQLRKANKFLDEYCPLTPKDQILGSLLAPATAGGILYWLFRASLK